MNPGLDQANFSTPDALGVITRELRVQILNCSSSGCLLESNSQIEVGTIASLAMRLGDEHLTDDIRVVRCQAIEGAGSVFHIGAEFLWTAAPGRTSLRLKMQFRGPDEGYGRAIR